ncbi:Frizzled-2 [Eufriesea mexicana]|uniref:Frizzled-2 n=1 Tax=Eufriesea mexicana TaxID=516756 RepID=A0A310SPC6_9HYME|nr:Frizzled-2 [Eufriesea mexicana]
MGFVRRTKLLPSRTMASLLPLLLLAVLSNARLESAISPVSNVGSVSSGSSSSSSSASSSSMVSVVPGSGSASGSMVGSGNSVVGGDSSGLGHSSLGGGTVNGNGRCEEIMIPMCQGIGYNLTAMPNDNQEEAGLEVHQFWPLVAINSSPVLKFFLCSVYTPICLPDYTKPLPACRSVCERARAGCAPLMQQYVFSWPEIMACEKLPTQGGPENLCMEQDNHTSSTDMGPGTEEQTLPEYQTALSRATGRFWGGGTVILGPISGSSTSNVGNGTGLAGMAVSGVIPAPPISIVRSIVQDIAGVPNCTLPCHGAFLTPEEREFAAVWLALWSGLCAASMLVTVTTFLIDTQRFKYPERLIVFLSACYFAVSVGYLSRSVFGHEEIACDGLAPKSRAQGPEARVAVFLMVYFFGMASSVWWVIFAFTWFLAAALKWDNEAIVSYSQYFHLVAWLAPAVQTFSAYLAVGLAGDRVAGGCTVAPEGIRSFILVPLFVYPLLGTSFLLAGFVSLFRIRSVVKRQPGAKAESGFVSLFRIRSVVKRQPGAKAETGETDDTHRRVQCSLHATSRSSVGLSHVRDDVTKRVARFAGMPLSTKSMTSLLRPDAQVLYGARSGGHGGGGAEMVAGVAGVNGGIGSTSIKGVVGHVGVPYPPAPGPDSALLPPGSVASASQHYLHDHVLKQPPLLHPFASVSRRHTQHTASHTAPHTPHSAATIYSRRSLAPTGPLTPAHGLAPSYTQVTEANDPFYQSREFSGEIPVIGETRSANAVRILPPEQSVYMVYLNPRRGDTRGRRDPAPVIDSKLPLKDAEDSSPRMLTEEPFNDVIRRVREKNRFPSSDQHIRPFLNIKLNKYRKTRKIINPATNMKKPKSNTKSDEMDTSVLSDEENSKSSSTGMVTEPDY